MDNNSQKLPCLVCGCQLAVKVAKGRRSGKPFVMIICPADGRHFRGFIGDIDFVKQVAQAAGVLGVEPPGTQEGEGGGEG